MKKRRGPDLRLALWRLTWPVRARLSAGLGVGATFPDFALRDTFGRSHVLSKTERGTLTVLWFTNFCEDCRAQFPALREAVGRARVLAVSILPYGDPLPQRVAPECGFPVLLDPEDLVSDKLGLAHPPGACPIYNIFIVDAAGRILFKHHLSAIGGERFREVLGGHLRTDGIEGGR